MQGHLCGEPLTFTIETECAHCNQLIELQIDSNLNVHVLTIGAAPVVFVPLVNLVKLDDPSIIDAF